MDMEISGTLPQRINSCLEVLDELLTQENEPVLATMVVAEKKLDDSKKGNIIDVIMNIMSIRDRKLISMDSSLSKLGIDSLMGVEILQVLERDFNVVVSAQEMRTLTLSELEKLVLNTDSKGSSKTTLKLEQLLTSFGDEKTSNEVILKLNNFKENGKNNLNLKEDKVLIIPGLEGAGSAMWFEFAAKFKNPTYALQFSSTAEAESLDKIVDGVKDVS